MVNKTHQPLRLLAHLALGVVTTVLVWIAALPCPAQADNHCPDPGSHLTGEGAPVDCVIATANNLNLPDVMPSVYSPPPGMAGSGHVLPPARDRELLDQRIRPDDGPRPHRLRLHLRYTVLLT
jgi:hypothetical protein